MGQGGVARGGDAACLLALCGAEGAGVVAVGASRAVADEGGAAVGYLVLTTGEGSRGVERIADAEGAKAHETAAVGGGRSACGEQFSVEHAAGDVEGAVAGAFDAAVCAVAADAAMYDDAAAAVLDGQCGPVLADNTGGVLGRGVDVARHVQVLDGSGLAAHVADVAERGNVLFAGVAAGGAVVEGQRVLLSVEGAAEVMATAARHAADGDVGAEADGLAAEAVVGFVVVEKVAEDVPARSVVDGVGRALSGVVGAIEADDGRAAADGEAAGAAVGIDGGGAVVVGVG